MQEYQFSAYRHDWAAQAPQPFEVFSYPMGDVTVRCCTGDVAEDAIQVLTVNTPAPDWSVVYNWAELVDNAPRRVLVLPYLPSARGDKDKPCPARVNARLAALSGITDLITADPHSPTWIQELNAANPQVRPHTMDIASLTAAVAAPHGYSGVIAPDAGARTRAFHVAEKLRVPIFVATKKRDPEKGKLLSYQAPEGIAGRRGTYLVVDDICDGGGTFALLTQAFEGLSVELDLWVTHGGFTKGLHGLLDSYRNIHTTDSLTQVRAAHDEAKRIGQEHRFHLHTLRWIIQSELANIDYEEHQTS